jgi:ATP-dependent exoDNAse (exonuclease V) alpha subunit
MPPDVFFGTVQGFKGLERSVVVLAINGIHANASQKEMLYVGMTRARDRLVVVGTKTTISTLKQNRSETE